MFQYILALLQIPFFNPRFQKSALYFYFECTCSNNQSAPDCTELRNKMSICRARALDWYRLELHLYSIIFRSLIQYFSVCTLEFIVSFIQCVCYITHIYIMHHFCPHLFLMLFINLSLFYFFPL